MLKMKAVRSSELSVNFCQTTRRHIPPLEEPPIHYLFYKLLLLASSQNHHASERETMPSDSSIYIYSHL
jgi:hypothetical protein